MNKQTPEKNNVGQGIVITGITASLISGVAIFFIITYGNLSGNNVVLMVLILAFALVLGGGIGYLISMFYKGDEV